MHALWELGYLTQDDILKIYLFVCKVHDVFLFLITEQYSPCEEGQEGWPAGHESKWKSATDRSGKEGTSPGQDRDLG